jgi:hypothetical protein
MLNGRHFLLLGVIACAGLVSVHDGQKQVDTCYQIGSLEKNLRSVREEIELNKLKHLALQSPAAVTSRTEELHLNVGPVPTVLVTDDKPNRAADSTQGLGQAQGARRTLAPPIPSAPPRNR